MDSSVSNKIEPSYRLGATIGLLVIITVLVFLPVRNLNFVVWDDPRNIVKNPLYQPGPYDHMAELLTKPYFAAYIPVTRLVWAALANTVAGENGAPTVNFEPAKYHTANLIVHVLNVLLVFFLLRLIVRKDWAAGLGALLFAIHPLQVEPVAWATGMKDLLSAFFSLCALSLYLLFATSKGERPAWGLYAAASLAFILAVLSKSSAMVVPVVAFLLDYLVTKPRTGANIGEAGASDAPWLSPHRRLGLGIWLVLTIPAAYLGMWADRLVPSDNPEVAIWMRPFVAGDTIAFYLEKLVAPIKLGPEYDRTPVWLMSHGWAYVRILIPVALFAIAWRYRRKSAWPLIGLAIFVAGVLPVSGLVPFDFQGFSTVADRYTYFAMFGPALAAACFLGNLPWRNALAIGSVALGVLAFLTVGQIPIWTNTSTLFNHALEVNPQSAVSYTMLAQQADSLGDLDGAIADYRHALEIDPHYVTALGELAIDLGHEYQSNPSDKGLVYESERMLEEAVARKAAMPAYHVNLANAYYALGRKSDAITQYKIALRLEPNNSVARNNLAIIQRGN